MCVHYQSPPSTEQEELPEFVREAHFYSIQPLVDEVIEKGSGRRFKAQFLEIMAGGLHRGERASRTCG